MPSSSCCTTVGREFKGPMFDLTEHSALANADDGAKADDSVITRRMNIQKTLSPRPRPPCIGAKLFFMAWAISLLSTSIRDWTPTSFWLAYLTHWGFVVTTAYTVMSFLSATFFAMRTPANPGALEGGAGLLVKTTWHLFVSPRLNMAVALPAEIIIAILYWGVVFDYSNEGFEYGRFMVHGGMVAPIIIDGFFLSRLPLRVKQFMLFETFSFLYVLWTIIHAYSGLGNPSKSEDQTDDAIYDSLAWKNNPTGAVVLSVIVLFVANPIIFLCCRAISRVRPRRLCEEGERQQSFKGQHFENEETADEEAAVVVY